MVGYTGMEFLYKYCIEFFFHYYFRLHLNHHLTLVMHNLNSSVIYIVSGLSVSHDKYVGL